MIRAENYLINSKIEFPALVSSSGPEDTLGLGKALARDLKNGSVVALSGPLGAGKTCLAKGIALALGVEDEVTSPTYTIVSEYEGKGAVVYHIDAYRLKNNDDFSAIGGEEIIYGDGISIIEWCENIEDSIPDEALRVDIEIKGENEREFNIYRGKK